MANFWMTVGSNPHLHTDARVRRTLCRQHVLLSAVTMTITVLENYKLCGGNISGTVGFRLFGLLGRTRDYQTLASDVLVLENSPY